MAQVLTRIAPDLSGAGTRARAATRLSPWHYSAVGFLLATFCLFTPSARGQVLFDNTKAETAGNADWIIDTSQPIPSPSISGISSSTSESYWTGALSSWGVALAKLRISGQISLPGNGLETLPTGGSITYGNSSNSQDLSHYQVYVVCEPNIRFTDAEKTAILNFVANGGGLFMVADHNGSDRNNDGIDSLAVWNDLMYTNSVQSNPLGFKFNADSGTPTATVDSSPSNPLTHGLGGTVTTLKYDVGATMTINNTTTTHASVWSTSSTTSVMALYGTYGAGRFVAIGDSSVVEDATSSSGTTYAGWTTPVDNGYCVINGTVWLLGTGTNTATPPTATTGTASGVTATTAVLNGTVNPNGQSTTALFQYGLTTSYGSTAPVSGTFTGTTAQAVSATITGLTPGTTYHFRVAATNAAGLTSGLDQMFPTTASAVVDLAITTTHAANFTQGDTGDLYTIVVTNIGTLATTGTVSVVDALPAGLTATAIGGTGWTPNLSTLTCTRSDALAAGAAYPAITVSVTVAANSPASVTNTATVSGGGDTNAANNTASDATTISAATAPTATTGTATGIGTTSATLNGGVDPNGQTTTAHFDYGLTTSYGSMGSVSGSLSGTTTQAVSTTITGLTAATIYHFRVAATNALGSTNGLDQTFTTATVGAPDLAITATHTGNFTQGDTGDTYTIIVTNVGTAAASGTVTVIDALPVGLTATAISGGGWTTSLATLTCTRSDALAAGVSYPAITVTFNVATNAAAGVTNTATVSGGGDTNSVNNTASDPTTINPASTGGIVTLAGWDVSGLTSYGTSPMLPTTNAANVSVGGLTRGSGVGTTGTAAARAWGGNDFADTTSAAAVTANHFATFTVAPMSGYKVSFASISRFDYRRSSTGPPNGLLQYQIGSAGFTDITTLSYSSTASTGASLGPIDLSGISALQSIGPGTNVTFRIVNYGGAAAGNWYLFDVANSTAPDLAVQGTVSPAITPAADLTISARHTGNFTQGDIGDSYTITVTNIGTAATVGTVSVTNALPAGLTPTGISGTGWTVNLANLTCTRSDVLPTGTNYPPITVTVNVNAGAPSGVTNTATVSGGGDVNPANNTASDPTTIIPAAAPTAITEIASGVGTSTATLNGTIDPNGQPATVHFDYGLTLAYGSTASVSGTLTGTTAQAVSASLTGLNAGMTYHYRVSATNVLGATNGADRTFATPTPSAPDLAITTSHTGNFTQGDTGDTYTVIVTNIGTAASSGTVTVVDVVPAGLTVTAIGGTGWSTNLNTLTCTRSDTLAVGAAFQPITITVNVAANAPAAVTNTVAVSGGGDTSPTNNNTSDATTINAAAAPTVTTGAASNVGISTATLNGAVDPNGQCATVQFQYGPTTDYGSNAVIAGCLLGTTTQPVSTSLTGLLPGTTYHFRVAATNVLGATAGQDQSFTTPTPIEVWRLQWFGTNADSGAAADTAVATSDGMANLLKYALGLNPLVATNDPVAGDISTGFLRLIVPKNPDATDVTFHVEVTSDVTAASWTTNGTTVDLDTATLLQVHVNTPIASSDGAFIRLRVSRP